MPFDQRSLIHWKVWFSICFVRQNQHKNKLFLCGNFRPLPNQNVQIWDHFFPLLFFKDSESLKILDIRLWEVGAKRCLNGTSKVNTRTDTQTDRSGLYIYIGSDLWNIRQLLRRPGPLSVRYHRALCLGRQDDRIRRISQASNIKKPTRFMGTSWIVGSDKGHDSVIQSICLFCYWLSTSATLCQDAK